MLGRPLKRAHPELGRNNVPDRAARGGPVTAHAGRGIRYIHAPETVLHVDTYTGVSVFFAVASLAILFA